MDSAPPKPPAPDRLPPVADWFQNGFHKFLHYYLRRHFDAVAVAKENRLSLADRADSPIIVYANHPSWWDPLIAHYLNHRLLPGRQFRAPIDADALRQYAVFERLGFFGVQANSRAGVSSF